MTNEELKTSTNTEKNSSKKGKGKLGIFIFFVITVILVYGTKEFIFFLNEQNVQLAEDEKEQIENIFKADEPISLKITEKVISRQFTEEMPPGIIGYYNIFGKDEKSNKIYLIKVSKEIYLSKTLTDNLDGIISKDKKMIKIDDKYFSIEEVVFSN